MNEKQSFGERSESPIPRKQFKVLLLEDNADDELLALRALNSADVSITVDVARDGNEALRALGLDSDGKSSSVVVPDLVISDLKMPFLRGDELLERVRGYDLLTDVPYVLFSSSDEEKDIERCMTLGATAYCVKPVDFDMFCDCVRDMVKRWLTGQSIAPSCMVNGE